MTANPVTSAFGCVFTLSLIVAGMIDNRLAIAVAFGAMYFPAIRLLTDPDERKRIIELGDNSIRQIRTILGPDGRPTQ